LNCAGFVFATSTQSENCFTSVEPFVVARVSVLEFWALIGHLKWARLQKSSKSRSICGAGWSSLVARRAHNPEVVGSNPTPATKLLLYKELPQTCNHPNLYRKDIREGRA
jgi:hypothetical protein